MKPFRLLISSPEGILFQNEIVKLDVRGAEGDLAVMAGHTPFITSLQNAPIILWNEDGTSKKATSDGGILTVGREKVILLSTTFHWE